MRSYTAYGADIVAVADGIIVEVRDDLEDQVPPFLPDPKTITVQTLLGNHVIQDIGQGAFAFYAHMQKGSVAVAPGDRVRRGQGLGKLGNSGNTSAPHLHFHIMAGAAAIGSNGIPYVIDAFALAGQSRRTPPASWQIPITSTCSPSPSPSSGSSRSTWRSSTSRPEMRGRYRCQGGHPGRAATAPPGGVTCIQLPTLQGEPTSEPSGKTLDTLENNIEAYCGSLDGRSKDE